MTNSNRKWFIDFSIRPFFCELTIYITLVTLHSYFISLRSLHPNTSNTNFTSCIFDKPTFRVPLRFPSPLSFALSLISDMTPRSPLPSQSAPPVPTTHPGVQARPHMVAIKKRVPVPIDRNANCNNSGVISGLNNGAANLETKRIVLVFVAPQTDGLEYLTGVREPMNGA